MANYEGEKCSKCGREFRQGDEIVVCPDCGAPYHRACMKELKECVFKDKHGTAEAYKTREERERESREAEERKVDGRKELRCSRCGTLNPIDGLFCEVCGTPLKKQIDAQQQQNEQNRQNHAGRGIPPFGQGGPFSGGFGQNPYNTIPYNPFTTPFGGLNPDEEIDGIPVKDLAIYLGQNSHYYLPRFKQMKERNSNSWNWSAFLLEYYFLFYRKMHGLGVLVLLAMLLLFMPVMGLNYDLVLQEYSPDAAPVFDQRFLLTMYYVFSLLQFGIRIFLGMFFNRLYMNRVFRNIRKLRDQYGDSQEYHSMLVKNGSVSIKGIIIVLSVTFVTWIAAVFFMLLTIV